MGLVHTNLRDEVGEVNGFKSKALISAEECGLYPIEHNKPSNYNKQNSITSAVL